MKPERGTPEWDLWVTAISIATTAPITQKVNTSDAKIPWKLIHELRGRLEAVGIDWRTAKERSHGGNGSD